MALFPESAGSVGRSLTCLLDLLFFFFLVLCLLYRGSVGWRLVLGAELGLALVIIARFSFFVCSRIDTKLWLSLSYSLPDSVNDELLKKSVFVRVLAIPVSISVL